MWHDVVSAGNKAASLAIVQFMDMFWRHPFVAAGFMVTLLVLAAMFWGKTLTENAARRSLPEDKPILVRR